MGQLLSCVSFGGCEDSHKQSGGTLGKTVAQNNMIVCPSLTSVMCARPSSLSSNTMDQQGVDSSEKQTNMQTELTLSSLESPFPQESPVADLLVDIFSPSKAPHLEHPGSKSPGSGKSNNSESYLEYSEDEESSSVAFSVDTESKKDLQEDKTVVSPTHVVLTAKLLSILSHGSVDELREFAFNNNVTMLRNIRFENDLTTLHIAASYCRYDLLLMIINEKQLLILLK